MNGILLINKPQGFTSFDVIAKLRGILKIKRLGHAGTLDPMATGVLPVFVGKATRACDIIPNNEKSYTASFRLGISTDTQDTTGKTISTSDRKVTAEEITAVIPEFLGEIEQLPPMYSAVSVNGQRLYDLARKGIEVERTARKITVDKLELLSFDEENQTGELFISCSKGTYIRTIIHDLGERLGCGGAMSALVRNSSSGFKLEDCIGFDEVKSLFESGRLLEKIVPVERIFVCLGKIQLDEIQTPMYKNGVRLDVKRICADIDLPKYRIYGYDDVFLGTAFIDKNAMELVCDKNFFEN